MMIELHPKSCTCHGGSWMSFVGQTNSPCSGDGRLPQGAVLVPVEQWRAMGKPHDVEEFDLALLALKKTVVTRKYERFDLAVPVRLWCGASVESADLHEDTATENLSRGGARVLSHLPCAKGDVVWFEHVTGHFRCRAQVRDVTGDEQARRLHLRFIDTLAPDEIFATSH